MLSKRKRILIYSHDTYGLGHLRRSLVLAGRLGELRESPDILIVTGSPKTQSFRMPEGCDCLKLPCVTKDPDGGYRSRTLRVPLKTVLGMRSEMIRTAVSSFQPHLVLVDHAPVGVEGELVPVFEDLRAMERRPRMVLGLRDIIDEASRVSAEWLRLGVEPHLKDLYDRILVYGDSSLRTTAEELGLFERYPDKIACTGYVARRPDGWGERRIISRRPVVLVTVGGGGDGVRILRSYARFLEKFEGKAPFHSVVVTGPFLSQSRFREIVARFEQIDQPLEVVRFTNRMESYLSAASGVISMGGYNSVTEILRAGKPALLVPREEPRREQLIRAERLTDLADIRVARMARNLPEQIGAFVASLDGQGHAEAARLDLGGLDRFAQEIQSLLRLGRQVPVPDAGRHVRSS